MKHYFARHGHMVLYIQAENEEMVQVVAKKHFDITTPVPSYETVTNDVLVGCLGRGYVVLDDFNHIFYPFVPHITRGEKIDALLLA